MSIPDMPFTDDVWRNLPPTERRRLATVWYRRAQPIPRQRGSIPHPTRVGGRVVARNTARALAVLVALQRGAGDLDTCQRDLDMARRDMATLRLRADIGTDLARELFDEDIADTTSRIAELSALLLSDSTYADAATAALDLRDGAAS